MDYFIRLELVVMEPRVEVLEDVEFPTTAPERFINEWLAGRGLPRLSSWYFDGATGSNAPRNKGILNSVWLKTKGRPEKLVITTHELRPVKPDFLF